jgi:hypothetical protein
VQEFPIGGRGDLFVAPPGADLTVQLDCREAPRSSRLEKIIEATMAWPEDRLEFVA